MKSWEHLIATGMAEMLPVDEAEVVLNRFIEKLKPLNRHAPDRLFGIIRYRCKVVRFKKGAVIIDFGQRNPQFLFRESGSVEIFDMLNGRVLDRSWITKEDDWHYPTQTPFEDSVSDQRMIAREHSVFVTIHLDDYRFLSEKFAAIQLITLGLANILKKQSLKNLHRHRRSTGRTLGGM